MRTVKERIVPAVITALLLGFGAFALSHAGLSAELTALASALALLIILGLLILFFRPIRRKIVLLGAQAELKRDSLDQHAEKLRDALTRLVEAPNGSEISKVSGLTGWYPSFDTCRPHLEFLLTKATSAKILTYIGASDIGKGTVFYEAICRNPGISVRVLLASEHSPYISPVFAPRIGHSETQASVWKRRILGTQTEIRHLRAHHHTNITMKSHDLPFVWRLWFIDEVLFVTAMLYYTGKENRRVPAYEIHRSGDQSKDRLFEMFESFFDREWDRAHDLE